METTHTRASSRRLTLHPVLRGLLVLWALFWIVLVALMVVGEGPSGWWRGAVGIALMTAVVVSTWLRPRGGGLVLIIAGVYAAYFFDHLFPQLWLATPAILLGLAFVLIPRRPRPAADGPGADPT